MVGGVADRIKRRVRIQKLLELGYSIGAICDEEQCSRVTVRWKKRLQEGEGEQDRPRRGRPRKLTPALKRQVIDRAEGKRHVKSQHGRVAPAQRHVRLKRNSSSHLEGGWLIPISSTQTATLDSKTEAQRRVAFARQYMDLDWERTH